MNTVVTFESRVKEKLKEIVADLIPEDRWEELVKQTVAEFERNDLPKMVKEALTEQYRAVIADEFKKAEWQMTFDGGRQKAGEALQKLLVDTAPLIIAGMAQQAAQQVFYSFQSAVQNGRGF